MKKFWNWVKNEDGRTLYFDGYIAQDSWFDDDITPKKFKAELTASAGDIAVWLNSPGGDVFAASQIYTMLKEYEGKVTVKIDGIAASAASVIAMAGDEIVMSPVAMMMIHNPATVVFGEAADLASGIKLLNEVKESLINASGLKTGLSRARISHMMNDETWMNPVKAKELGFCDEILFSENEPQETGESMFFSSASVQQRVMNCLLEKMQAEKPAPSPTPTEPRTSASALKQRLDRLKYDY